MALTLLEGLPGAIRSTLEGPRRGRGASATLACDAPARGR